jgi:hypothetical protein
VAATPTAAFAITSIAGTGTAVTYTGSFGFVPFVVGQTVTITGATTTAYNLTNAVVTAVSNNSFTVANSATGTTSTASAVSTSTQGNLQEWQGPTGTALANVSSAGDITANSFVKTGGTSSQFLKADGTVDSTTYTDLSTSQTLTNKTIALGSNTVSGTLAEFNTAVTDADLASLAGSETLTNKTLGSGTSLSANLSAGTNKITNLATPEASTDAATKAYVDSVEAGLLTRPQVRAATTANLPANYSNGTFGVGATLTSTTNGAFPLIDGVELTTVNGARGILVKNQTNAAHNGRYNLTTQGDSGTPWVLTRCALCDEADEIPGSYIFVTDGTANGQTGWVQHVNDPATFTVGTDAILVFQFSGAGAITAGAGITVEGNQVSLNPATSTTLGGVELFSDTQQSVASNAVSSTESRTYGLQVNSSGQGVINVPWTDTDTNTTYAISAETVTGGANLRLTGSDSTNDDIKIEGSGSTTVTRTDENTITISSTGGSGGSSVTVSDTAPSTPAEGDLWYNSAVAKTYIYYDDFWVQTTPTEKGETGIVDATSPILYNSGTKTISIDQSLISIGLAQVDGIEGKADTSGKLSQFAATTSSELAGVISDETGTGNLVFSNSPALTTPSITGDVTITGNVISHISRNPQTASYSLVLSDDGKLVEVSSTSANTVTIPLNSAHAFPEGTQIVVMQTNTGQTTINGSVGVTINASPQATANTAVLRGRWSSATLIKRAENTWVVVGDLA